MSTAYINVYSLRLQAGMGSEHISRDDLGHFNIEGLHILVNIALKLQMRILHNRE